jgi:hypothetical protein
MTLDKRQRSDGYQRPKEHANMGYFSKVIQMVTAAENHVQDSSDSSTYQQIGNLQHEPLRSRLDSVLSLAADTVNNKNLWKKMKQVSKDAER